MVHARSWSNLTGKGRFLEESSEVWLECDGRVGLTESDRWNFHSGLDYT